MLNYISFLLIDKFSQFLTQIAFLPSLFVVNIIDICAVVIDQQFLVSDVQMCSLEIYLLLIR